MQLSPASRFKEIFEWIVNLCLVGVSCILIVFCVSYFRDRKVISRQTTVETQGTLSKGESLKLDTIRKANPSGRLLLIALQSGCRFCKESIPMYRNLVAQSNALNAKVVFIFAEPMATALKYVKENQINTDDLQHEEFKAIHVNGTPTMILVDANNNVMDYWVGEIKGNRLSAFYKELGATQ